MALNFLPTRPKVRCGSRGGIRLSRELGATELGERVEPKGVGLKFRMVRKLREAWASRRVDEIYCACVKENLSWNLLDYPVDLG